MWLYYILREANKKKKNLKRLLKSNLPDFREKTFRIAHNEFLRNLICGLK
jgi:uncharacterized membrane protein YheB (UPF0754 family)